MVMCHLWLVLSTYVPITQQCATPCAFQSPNISYNCFTTASHLTSHQVGKFGSRPYTIFFQNHHKGRTRYATRSSIKPQSHTPKTSFLLPPPPPLHPPHPPPHRLQARVPRIHQRANPLPVLLLPISIIHLAAHHRVAQQRARHIDVHRLVRVAGHTKRLVEEADVLRVRPAGPRPRVAVDVALREPGQALEVAEVEDVHHRVLAAAVAGLPPRQAQQPVVLGLLLDLVEALEEVAGDLGAPGAEEAERVVEADAEVEDDDGVGGGRVLEAARRATRQHRHRAPAAHVPHVRVAGVALHDHDEGAEDREAD